MNANDPPLLKLRILKRRHLAITGRGPQEAVTQGLRPQSLRDDSGWNSLPRVRKRYCSGVLPIAAAKLRLK